MAHNDCLDILDRVSSGLNLFIQLVLRGVPFARRYIVHLSGRKHGHSVAKAPYGSARCPVETHRAPVLFHLICTACFKEKQPGGRVLDQDSVDNHFDTFMFRVGIACASSLR